MNSDLMRSSRKRLAKDRIARIAISAGGSLVLVALLLIFFYLLTVVAPLFSRASITPTLSSPYLSLAPTVHLGMDESNQYGYRVSADGVVEFYHLSGAHQTRLVSRADAKISAFAASNPQQSWLGFGFSDGYLQLLRPEFIVDYSDGVRTIAPRLTPQLDGSQMQLDKQRQPITQLALEVNDQQITVVWQDSALGWHLTRYYADVDFIAETRQWQRVDRALPQLPPQLDKVLLTPDQRQMFVLASGRVSVWQMADIDNVARLQILTTNQATADIQLLPGGSSLLLQSASAQLSQWFAVRSDHGRLYQQIRQFELPFAATAIATEYFRKTVAVADNAGALQLLYTTSERQLLTEQFNTPINAMAFSPAGTGLMLDQGQTINLFAVDNPHPEISFSALWDKVWYEGYPEPAYVWQSTSGSEDFEAKLSLMPLLFGTIKAALYAMLFAVPIAISGAIYTAYFMTAKVRGVVKPTIEIMEALPTVILGFLAGLWLAPIVETHLAGVLLLLLLMPITILLVALGWRRLPERIQQLPLLNYRELLLLPLLLLVGWGCLAISPVIEQTLLGGDGRAFVTNQLGIDFDQRNALVVGLAMGFAVVPTIFSIAEDAIYSVPRHLVNGSLALGATQWQTLTRVVLLTASPGIFSATMMGFGRAVGETMIVLMATGNTAIMKWNLFEGMRTLAANIAIEMPESALGSSHYRLLFLTALVLFVFTFVINTIAELVRQRLRDKYANL